MPQGVRDDAADPAPPPAPPPALYERIDVIDSARPGWYIVIWRHVGTRETLRNNVNPEILRHKMRTPNLVMRGLYEWQLAQLP